MKRSRSEEEGYSVESGSSSDSDSESGSDRKRKHKKYKKADKKADKKSDKKSKKHKKEKKEKKDKKKHKRKKYKDYEDDDKFTPYVSEEQAELDAKEIEDFKRAVQSRKGNHSSSDQPPSDGTYSSSSSSNTDIYASADDIAAKYGISKGLIRTSESSLSITQKFSKTIFGGDDDNPATRQRMKREHVAKQAMLKARAVIAMRQAEAAAKGVGDTSDVCNLMNTFRSSNNR
jgi:hypothetical protein